jgi:hypothetical protein
MACVSFSAVGLKSYMNMCNEICEPVQNFSFSICRTDSYLIFWCNKETWWLLTSGILVTMWGRVVGLRLVASLFHVISVTVDHATWYVCCWKLIQDWQFCHDNTTVISYMF